MRKLMLAALAGIGVALLAAPPASAAYLGICDSPQCGTADPNMTFSLNDFENGFSVNGSQVQLGLGNPVTVTMPEETNGTPNQITFSGSWIDNGSTQGSSQTIFFSEGNGSISDVLSYNYSTNGSYGSLSGYVMSSDTGFTSSYLSGLGITPTTTVAETGNAYDFSNAYITANFQSVPEPSSLAVFGTALVAFGLFFFGWRRFGQQA